MLEAAPEDPVTAIVVVSQYLFQLAGRKNNLNIKEIK